MDLQIRNQQSRKDYEEQQAANKALMKQTVPMEEVETSKAMTELPIEALADLKITDSGSVVEIAKAKCVASEDTAGNSKAVKLERVVHRKPQRVRPGFETYKPPHARQSAT